MDDSAAIADVDLIRLLDDLGTEGVLLDGQLRLAACGRSGGVGGVRLFDSVGRPLAELGLDFDITQLIDDARGVLRTREPARREVTTRDGRCLEVRVLARPRTPQGVLLAFTDISEQRDARDAARRLAAVVESLSEAVIVAAPDGRLLTWSRGAEKLFGLTKKQAEDLGFGQLLRAPSGKHADLVTRLSRGEKVEPYLARFTARDGREVDAVVSAYSITADSGEVVAITATVRDVTDRGRAEGNLRAAYAGIGLQFEERGTRLAHALETVNAELNNRRRVEEALRESQERIKAIVNNAAEGIISIDRAGVIDTFNPAAERLFGYQAREIIGQNVGVLMPLAESARHRGYLADYLNSGHPKIIGIGREVEGKRKDGALFPMELAIGEGTDGDGPFFVGIVRDLTARKQSENLLRTAERLAALGTLAAGLGHDMNNVLLPVRARLSALRAAADAGVMRRAEHRHTLEIGRSLDYLQQLADGLHYLAMDPDSPDAAGVSTDLHSWWRRAGALLTKSVAKNIRLTASIPAGLPAVGVPPHQLTQAILNLLVNAGEAITSSGLQRKGRIEVWAKRARDPAVGPCVKVGVTDNGKGMSDQVRAHAFDMFFTTKPRGMGTGLGLPLVHKIVAQAGGAVRIDTKEGEGATVSMALPVVSARPAEANGSPAAIRALISVRDGRASSLLQQMFAVNGARVSTGDRPARHQIWVVEPLPEHLKTAAAWKARYPKSRLVLLGDPDTLSRAFWMECRPIVIHNQYDFKQVRAALSLAGLGR